MVFESPIRPSPNPIAPVPVLLRTGLVGTPMAVRQVLQECTNALRRVGAAEEECVAFEIAVAEALNNIVEHAYAADPPGWVDLALRRGALETTLELRDVGAPLPCLPDCGSFNAVTEQTAVADLPDGGFGWGLIIALTRDVHYQRVGDENRLLLRFATRSDTAPQRVGTTRVG